MGVLFTSGRAPQDNKPGRGGDPVPCPFNLRPTLSCNRAFYGIDPQYTGWHIWIMSSTDVAATVSKLQSLSPERAEKVLSLIDDLAELEALEDAEDLKDAREAIEEMRASSAATSAPAQFINTADANLYPEIKTAIPWDQIRRELKL
jgi:hypothetical protein